MRALLALALLLATVVPASAEPFPRGATFAVFAATADDVEDPRFTAELFLARALSRELERSGYRSQVLARSVATLAEDNLDEVVKADWFVEITAADAADGSYGTIGGFGDRAGAGVSILSSFNAADVTLYEAATLRPLATFRVDARAIMPALTSVGAVGDHFWIDLALPLFERAAANRAARAFARRAIAEMQHPAEEDQPVDR